MTAGKVMRGPALIRFFLAEYLKLEMPLLLDVAREQWGLEQWELPQPQRWDAYDPLVADVYPTVGSLIINDRNWRRQDMNSRGEEVFASTYNVQAFIWCATPTQPDGIVPDHAKERAMMLRDDEFSIMRSCILATPSLGSGGKVRVQRESMTSSFLEPISVSQQSPVWLAGATLTFDVQMSESAYLPVLGVVEDISVTARKIDE